MKMKNIKKNQLYNSILIIVVVLCIFQDYLSSFVLLFKYYDEMLCIIAIPLFVFRLIANRGKIKSNKFERKIVLSIALLVLLGIFGFCLNSTQPLAACLGDLLLNLKWFLAIYLGFYFSSKITKMNYKLINNFLWAVSILFLSLLMLNMIFHIFEGEELRFGVQIPRLFYSHSSVLASMGTLLMVITYACYKKIYKPNVLIFFQISIILATLRFKAIAIGLVGTLVFIITIVNKHKLKWWHYFVMALGAIAIAYNQISTYYGIGISKNARGMLTLTAIKIAQDEFPLGVGFGTFGCHMSKVFYSNIYSKYGIDLVWGLSKASGSDSFISDTFWPMILGQFGVFGMLIYIYIIYLIYKEIKKIWNVNRFYYLSGVVILTYLLIESTASAAFVGPEAVPFGIWLGIVLTYRRNYYKERINKNG